jgi:hypothetical protein
VREKLAGAAIVLGVAVATETVGAVFAVTVYVTFLVAVRPPVSVTVTVAVYVPGVVRFLSTGAGPVAVVPSAKRQAYVSACLSTSAAVALNVKLAGAACDAGVAVAVLTVGALFGPTVKVIALLVVAPPASVTDAVTVYVPACENALVTLAVVALVPSGNTHRYERVLRSGSTAVARRERFAGATAGRVATASVKLGGKLVTTETDVVAVAERLSVSVAVTVPVRVPTAAAVRDTVAPVAVVPSENTQE